MPWDDPRGVCFAALVGTSPQEVRRAVSLEDREASSREFGHLYQYPPCCVEAYEDLRVGEDWVHAYLRRSPLDVHGYRVANRLAALFDGATLLPEYYPCTAHCSGTRDLGQGLAAILRRAGLAALCEHLFWSLSQPILVRHGALYRLTDAMLDCERLTFNPASVERVVWQSDPGDDKLLLQANALVAGQQQLQFMAGAEVLAVEPVGRFHNRLLQFAP